MKKLLPLSAIVLLLLLDAPRSQAVAEADAAQIGDPGESGGKPCATCTNKTQAAPGGVEKIQVQILPVVQKLSSSTAAPAAPGCIPEDQRLAQAAKAEFDRLFPPTAAPVDGEVLGAKLKGSAEELEMAKDMLRPNPPLSWPAVAAGCADVRCALTKMWGSEESMQRAFTIAKKTGYFVSASQEYRNAVDAKGNKITYPDNIFPLSEIRALNKSIDHLPESYRHLSRMKYFFRLPKNSLFAGKPTTAAQAQGAGISGSGQSAGNITFADSAFNQDGDPALTIDHELTHQLDFHAENTPPDKGKYLHEKSGFLAKFGWKPGPKDAQGKDTWTHDPSVGYVTDYAQESPFEHFAETGAYYVNRPGILKEVSPDEYSLFKDKVFGGQEFTPRYPPSLQSRLADPAFRSDALKTCLRRFTEFRPVAPTSAGKAIDFQFWEIDSSKPEGTNTTYTTAHQLDGVLTQTGCFHALAEALAPKLTAPDLCELGGAVGLEKTLRNALAPELMGLLKSVQELTRSSSGSDVAGDCLKAKDLTNKCLEKGVRPLLRASFAKSPSVSQLSSAQLAPLEDELMRLSPKPVPPAILLLPLLSTAQTAAACITGIDKVRLKDGAIQYGEITSVENTGNGGQILHFSLQADIEKLQGCREKILEALESRGAPIEADALGLTVANQILQREPALQAIRSFQARFKSELYPAASACTPTDKPCRTKAVTASLQTWHREAGLPPPTPEAIEHFVQASMPW